jgi:two-component system, OmpR family, response regulator AdeR
MALNNKKIALIEDDLNLQNMYKLKLELEGYQVAVAGNGLEGLKISETFMPDLILLDLRMPIMSGDEMLAKLREQEWGSDIRVIVLTNISKNEAPQSLRFLSVDRYIVKAHSTPAQVVETIEEVLGKPGHINR